MSDHSGFLTRYRTIRETTFGINNHLVTKIPKSLMDECAKKLGFTRGKTFVFESESEMAVLMDYCLYYPGPDGRNLVAKYLEESPPPSGSDKMAVLQAMTRAYYSLFEIEGVERGVGVAVRDVLRNETGLIVDIGFGNTVGPGIALATRVKPIEGILTTGGAAFPVDGQTAARIIATLKPAFNVATFDFHRITPQQEAELAAIVIRACRTSGMSSHVAYEEPRALAGSARSLSSAGPRELASPTSIATRSRALGRNDPCPCGSGKKFKVCCMRR